MEDDGWSGDRWIGNRWSRPEPKGYSSERIRKLAKEEAEKVLKERLPLIIKQKEENKKRVEQRKADEDKLCKS